MTPQHLIILVLFIHFIADFISQSNWMAQNKSKSIIPLSVHILVYSSCFIVLGWKYALVNGLAHFITDFWTSKLTSKLYKEGKIHEFFVVIGFDQFIHASCLILTLPLIKLL